MTNMIAGGNGKARAFFKSNGIEGKRKEKLDGTRSVDFFDKTSKKYKQQLEKEAAAMCGILFCYLHQYRIFTAFASSFGVPEISLFDSVKSLKSS